MSATPRLLFVRAAPEFTDGIVDHFRELCWDHGVELVLHQFEDLYQFQSFACCDEQFEYVFVAAHGKQDGFGRETGPGQDWRTFADALCATGAVSSESHVFLGCCKGGRLAVSAQLYESCDLIGSICGPEPSVTLGQILAGFEEYFDAIADGRNPPMIATECAMETADAAFQCFELSEFGVVTECGDAVEVEIEFEESGWVEADAECEYVVDPECEEDLHPECDEGTDAECPYLVGPEREYGPDAEALCDDQSTIDDEPVCETPFAGSYFFGEGNCFHDERCIDVTRDECLGMGGEWCGI